MKRNVCLIFLCQIFCVLNLSSGIITTVHDVCIIGAGVTGLVTARYLQKYGVGNIKIFEATSDVGGIWKFDPRVGKDEYGIPIFSSMYENLRTNTPRQNMELAGFPFPDGTPSYPTGECYLKYLNLFAKYYRLTDLIQSYVTSVKREDNLWSVVYIKTNFNIAYKEYCNRIVIGTGRETKPRFPHVYGLNKFQGRSLHSHDYRSPVPFTGRRVLTIGAGPSGLDISVQLVNYTTKLIHSHHRPALKGLKLSSNYIVKPDVVSIVQNGVYFEDGSYENVDDIIFCTGYDLEHPYLDDSCGLVSNGKQVIPLYNKIINIRHPTMYFLGLVKMTGVLLFDKQADYVARHIARLFTLPSKDIMIDNWLNIERRLKNVGRNQFTTEIFGKFQNEYVFNMTAESGMLPTSPVIPAIRDLNLEVRIQDVPHYRDYDIEILDNFNFVRYLSPLQGNECPLEHFF